MDPERFRMIVKAHQQSTIAAAYRILGDYDDARDVAQDAFLAFHEKGDTVDLKRVRAWLVRVATNRAIDRARRRARMRILPDDALAQEQTVERTPLEGVAGVESRARVHEALASLPPRQREVVMLRVMQRMTFPEIGAVLNLNTGTAKVHFHRAIKKLQRRLEGARSTGGRHVDAP